MRVPDLHVLPKFRDGWSYLYVEHCRINQEAKAIANNTSHSMRIDIFRSIPSRSSPKPLDFEAVRTGDAR